MAGGARRASGSRDRSEHHLLTRLSALWRSLASAAPFLLALLLAPAAVAGSFSVSPLRIELSPGQRTVALTVHNQSEDATVVQAQLVAWTQADGEDRLEPTADLIASPPIFTLQPAATQTIRIALRRPADGAVERTYRILVTEVPGPAQPGFTGARFALKVSLPIFVEAATGGTAPHLQWTAKRLPGGDVAVSVSNAGSKHVQLRSLELAPAAGEADARSAGPLVRARGPAPHDRRQTRCGAHRRFRSRRTPGRYGCGSRSRRCRAGPALTAGSFAASRSCSLPVLQLPTRRRCRSRRWWRGIARRCSW